MEENIVTLTNAVYRILDTLPDSDPLKNRAKEKALAILEHAAVVFGASGWFSLQKEKASFTILEDIEMLINYLKVGKAQGWISGMNFLIITKGYGGIKSSVVLPERFLASLMPETNFPKRSATPKTSYNNKLNASNQLLVIQEASKEQVLSSKALARQKKILEILASNNKAQVSDIIKELPKITKRTIRRDLDDLLKKGKIIRAGNWNQVFYQIGSISS